MISGKRGRDRLPPQSDIDPSRVVPDMTQNALTGTVTVGQAVKDAADKMRKLHGGGGLQSRRAGGEPGAPGPAGAGCQTIEEDLPRYACAGLA